MTRTTNWRRTGTSPPDPPDAAPAFRPPGLRAGEATLLARVAGRLDALDDRVRRGPEGWRQRLALIEAADLGWFAGDRIAPDRLALWQSLRLSGAQDDAGALERLGWAVRRLVSGPGPAAARGFPGSP